MFMQIASNSVHTINIIYDVQYDVHQMHKTPLMNKIHYSNNHSIGCIDLFCPLNNEWQ